MIDDLVLQLARSTGLAPMDVHRIAVTAPRRYKNFRILKKDGVTYRPVSQPAHEVKHLQRAFADLVLNKLPVHSCATAYRPKPGLSLRDNVTPHAENGPILKMDFRDFFPSIQAADWISYCADNGIFSSSSDVDLSARLLFRRTSRNTPLRLAIGAPSSPILSNILMYDFDDRVFHEVGAQYVTYTRYADDLTFSAPRTGFLQGVQSIVAKIVRESRRPNLSFNYEKTRFVTTKFNRNVTGLTISLDGRVTAGQYRKRQVRAGVHQFSLGNLSDDATIRLVGLIAFIQSVEDDFVDKLRAKYSDKVMDDLLNRAVARKGKGRLS